MPVEPVATRPLHILRRSTPVRCGVRLLASLTRRLRLAVGSRCAFAVPGLRWFTLPSTRDYVGPADPMASIGSDAQRRLPGPAPSPSRSGWPDYGTSNPTVSRRISDKRLHAAIGASRATMVARAKHDAQRTRAFGVQKSELHIGLRTTGYLGFPDGFVVATASDVVTPRHVYVAAGILLAVTAGTWIE